jgi:hypothetical protein
MGAAASITRVGAFPDNAFETQPASARKDRFTVTLKMLVVINADRRRSG